MLSQCVVDPVFSGSRHGEPNQDPDPVGEGERGGFHPTVTVQQGQDLLVKLNVCKSVGPDDMHAGL